MAEMSDEELFALRDAWYSEAAKQTFETLPTFVKSLKDFPGHDYNTTVYAPSAAILGMAWSMAEYFGNTGFQASCIMWEFITNWMGVYHNKPLKLVNYADMLYPQYQHHFEKTITPDTWMWLQEQAKKKLEESGYACDEVKEHWKSIIDGKVPFGYTVRDLTWL